MKSRFMRAVITVCAAAFMFSAAPVMADDEGYCRPCEMCYDDTAWCLHCAEQVMKAIGGCCGNGSGVTYCVPDYGGFATNCDNGVSCQCNMHGGDCDPLMNE